MIHPLRILHTFHPSAHTVFLFDSLDRLPSQERFREAVHDDLRVLKAAGIGVAIVGHVRFIPGSDRALTDLFEHTHFQLPEDPEQAAGLGFLRQVLRQRSAADMPTSRSRRSSISRGAPARS